MQTLAALMDDNSNLFMTKIYGRVRVSNIYIGFRYAGMTTAFTFVKSLVMCVCVYVCVLVVFIFIIYN